MTAIRAIVTIGISLLFLAVCAPPMYENPPWPYTGLAAQRMSLLQQTVVVRVDRASPAYDAGLRTGDVVGCLSPINYEVSFPYFATTLPYTGKPVTLCARHESGAWKTVSFIPKRMPPPGLAYFSPFLTTVRVLVYAVFLFIGCALVLVRPSLMTWILFCYCVASGPDASSEGMLIALPATLYVSLYTATAVWINLGSAILALFALAVPAAAAPRGWRRTLSWCIAAAILLITILEVRFQATVNGGPLQDTVDSTFTILTIAITLVRLLSMAREERARFGWAAFAIILGVVVNYLRNVLSGQFSTITGFFTIIMPVALLYAILRRHVIDVRFVLSRTLVYAVLTTIVVVVIGVVDWATSIYLSEVRAALAIDAAVTIALGLALHRSYRWIEVAIDAVLFRQKHVAQAYLRRAARAILRARDEQTIDITLAQDPFDRLDLTMAAVFRMAEGNFMPVAAAGWHVPQLLAFAPGCELARFLEAERSCIAITDLRTHVAAEFIEAGAAPAVAIPIFRGDDLTAFVLYGLHRDGTQLDPDEVEALEHLCESAAQAYIMVELKRYQRLGPATMPAMEAP